MILEQYKSPSVQVTTKLESTDRQSKGFGSTGINNNSRLPDNLPNEISYKQDEINQPQVIQNKANTLTLNSATMDMIFYQPVNITTIDIQKIGSHPTLGLQDHIVHNDSDISKIIHSAKGPSLQISIIPPAPTDIHPETRLPQLNFDQFLHISSLHQYIITNSTPVYHQHDIDDPSNIVIHKLSERHFTRRQLLKRLD